MKRNLLGLVVVLVVVLGVSFLNNGLAGGLKTYETGSFTDTVVITGTATGDTIYSADRSLFDNASGSNITKFDGFLVTYYFNSVSENLDVSGVDNEGKADSIIVWTVFEAPYQNYIVLDTCATLPCTVSHWVDEDFVYGGTTLRDTTNALWLDYWYYRVYATDTAAQGAGDTLEFIFNGWWKAWEKK